MTHKDTPKGLPTDKHLREDISIGSDEEPEDPSEKHFVPGQTNAGQQVAGLASASDYGDDLDPDAQPDENNPV